MKVIDRQLNFTKLDTKQKNNAASVTKGNSLSSQGNQFDFSRLSDVSKIYFTANSSVNKDNSTAPKNAIQAANTIISAVGKKNAVRLDRDEAIKEAVANGEGVLTKQGALLVNTGDITGRAANDKFVTEDTDGVDYKTEDHPQGINKPISEEKFGKIYDTFVEHFKDINKNGKKAYIFDGYAGADKEYSLPVRFINEKASQSAFEQNVIFPHKGDEKDFKPKFTVIAAPDLKLDPEKHGVRSKTGIIVNLKKGIVLIAGTQYSGEIKKSVFTIMNYLLPQKGVLPMHCSAVVAPNGRRALLLGLSGTGKTTLSAIPEKKGQPPAQMIGDDEHGWSDKGIFNIEYGCYPKCINLSEESEPNIYKAVNTPGAMLENVPINPATGELDFTNECLEESKRVENTRAAYPTDYIANAVESRKVDQHPNTIIFLTCDATGTLPAISKLKGDQIKYHYMSGYTSKTPGTEVGITEPKTTFSSCFGEPFLPLPPAKYADMLADKINKHNKEHKDDPINVYLINTGWTGGPYGVGNRYSLNKVTRKLVDAAISGELDKVPTKHNDILNLDVPTKCPGIDDTTILDPEKSWASKESYAKAANELADKFVKNFEKFKSPEIAKAGPKPTA